MEAAPAASGAQADLGGQVYRYAGGPGLAIEQGAHAIADICAITLYLWQLQSICAAEPIAGSGRMAMVLHKIFDSNIMFPKRVDDVSMEIYGYVRFARYRGGGGDRQKSDRTA